VVIRKIRSAGLAATLLFSLLHPAAANAHTPAAPIQACWDTAGPLATTQWVAYSSFTDAHGTFDLFLDEYTPKDVGGNRFFPAAVLVHGGSWDGGCRTWLDGLSRRLADAGFIVFNIDYRLACDSPGVYLCGFNSPTPVADVQAAIAWARVNAPTYAPFNGHVAAVGTSAGGNLVYMAGLTGVRGVSMPDAMAGASGHPEMGYMSDLNAACREAFPPPGSACWTDSTIFLGFPLDASHDWCGDGGGDNWSSASPECNVDPLNLPPPTFIANATQELSSFRGATDFKATLDADRVPEQFCTVSGRFAHDHGSDLLNPGVPCDQRPGTDVITNLIEFLKERV